MKLVAKCSAFVSLSYQVHPKVCNPISLKCCVAEPLTPTSKQWTRSRRHGIIVLDVSGCILTGCSISPQEVVTF